MARCPVMVNRWPCPRCRKKWPRDSAGCSERQGLPGDGLEKTGGRGARIRTEGTRFCRPTLKHTQLHPHTLAPHPPFCSRQIYVVVRLVSVHIAYGGFEITL